MLETMRWVQWLEVEQRHLDVDARKRYGWRDITNPVRLRPHDGVAALAEALQTVTDRLNCNRVEAVVFWRLRVVCNERA